MEIKPIAHIRTDFPEKFGIPRQSGLVEELSARIVFEPEYRNADALRGLDGFSHLWLIWDFSEVPHDGWTPTVRPPRLGGNKRVGVFATRSPFRPNPLGLSVVRLGKIDTTSKDAPVIEVFGADLMDGTPIFDIKPYLPYVDSKPDAKNGFALAQSEGVLRVVFPENLKSKVPENKFGALSEVLSQDPRPQYQNDPERIYTMSFAGLEISFSVDGETLSVTDIRTE